MSLFPPPLSREPWQKSSMVFTIKPISVIIFLNQINVLYHSHMAQNFLVLKLIFSLWTMPPFLSRETCQSGSAGGGYSCFTHWNCITICLLICVVFLIYGVWVLISLGSFSCLDFNLLASSYFSVKTVVVMIEIKYLCKSIRIEKMNRIRKCGFSMI